ncbi:MAG: beta strand repeat-containing protein, partial [Nitrospinaceae bacterium]
STGYSGSTIVASTSLDITGSTGLILESDDHITNPSSGNVTVTSTLTELSGDLKVGGNDIISSSATAITLSGANAAVAGDLTVTGNDIISSSATAITLSGANVAVAGDLTVTGNDIISSSATAITLSGANAAMQGTVSAAGLITAIAGVDITHSSGLILQNDETITNSTDGTVLITSPTTSVSGDLSVGTSLQTATIDYTDGTLALTVASNGALTTSGNLTVGGTLSGGNVTASSLLADDIDTGDAAVTISTTTGAVNITPASGSAIVLDGTINIDAGVVTGATSITAEQLTSTDDLSLASDAAVLSLGEDGDVTLTHIADVGILLNEDNQFRFRDSDLKVYSSVDGQLDIDANAEVEITTATLDINGAVDISGTTALGGVVTLSTTNKVQFGDTGTYIHQSADGVLDLVSDDEVEINGNTIDINGDIDLTSQAPDIDLIDNDNSALSFDASGKAGILEIVTTNSSEIVKMSGDLDVDGTTNLDAVDIDGAVQADGTITVGVDDTGYDVKLFGATSGAHMLWDESVDDLKLVGAASMTIASDLDVDGTTNLD